jgi:hypothetical protein
MGYPCCTLEGDVVAGAESVVPCKRPELIAVVREEGVLTEELQSRHKEMSIFVREQTPDERWRLVRWGVGAHAPGFVAWRARELASGELPCP